MYFLTLVAERQPCVQQVAGLVCTQYLPKTQWTDSGDGSCLQNPDHVWLPSVAAQIKTLIVAELLVMDIFRLAASRNESLDFF